MLTLRWAGLGGKWRGLRALASLLFEAWMGIYGLGCSSWGGGLGICRPTDIEAPTLRTPTKPVTMADFLFSFIFHFLAHPLEMCMAALLYSVYWVALVIINIIWTWPHLCALALLGFSLHKALEESFGHSSRWTTTSATAVDATDEARHLSTATWSGTAAWIDTQRAIVDFRFFSPHGPPLPDAAIRLELRAQANARLVRAFGINNSLTTSSVHIHKQFYDKATALINEASQDPDRWTKLYNLAGGLLKQDIVEALLAAQPLGLADGVRKMCLSVVLADNFGEDAIVRVERDVLGRIAGKVNAVWVRSKCEQEGDGGRDEVLEEMIAGLGLRGDRGHGEELRVEEVLGIIMPQYETLWRVVLLTFVTAFHRQPRQENVKRVEGVPGCLGKGDEEALKLAMVSAVLSIEGDVELTLWEQEGLRLYPSNKRIYRARGVGMEGQVSGDVEACHRHADIWGDDALEFRPERFDGLSDLQKRAYFPYSMGRHKCPAVKVFGNRMITMLVVVLSRAMSPVVGKVTFGDEKLDGDVGAALPTGRDELEAWVMDFF